MNLKILTDKELQDTYKVSKKIVLDRSSSNIIAEHEKRFNQYYQELLNNTKLELINRGLLNSA